MQKLTLSKDKHCLKSYSRADRAEIQTQICPTSKPVLILHPNLHDKKERFEKVTMGWAKRKEKQRNTMTQEPNKEFFFKGRLD